MDDFLHGIARVREKMQAWEDVAMLTATFGRAGAHAHARCSFRILPGEGWLALEIDPATNIDSSRLLYTVHYAAGARRRPIRERRAAPAG